MKILLTAVAAVCSLLCSTYSMALATRGSDVTRWPYATVIYEFGLDQLRPEYEKAIQYWESQTNIRFINRQTLSDEEKAQHPFYVLLSRNSGGRCVSDNGYKDPPYHAEDGTPLQPTREVYIVSIDASCMQSATIASMAVPASLDEKGITAAHELGHALGFIHEHQRSDRHEYLFIAVPPLSTDWNTLPGGLTRHITDYDYLSIMHYYPWQGKSIMPGEPATIPQGYPEPWRRVGLPLVLGLDPLNPSSASAADLAKSERLRSNFPNYEARMHYREGFSEKDLIGVASFYAENIADLKVQDFKNLDFCSPSRVAEGSCTNLNQLTARSDVVSLGPWDSGRVTVTHFLPVGAAMPSLNVKVTSTNADRCQTSTAEFCEQTTCTNRPALVCVKSSTKPRELLRTEFTLTHPDASTHKYDVAVQVQSTVDDISANNQKSFTVSNIPRSGGCSGTPAAATQSTDPVLPALAMLAFLGVSTRKRSRM